MGSKVGTHVYLRGGQDWTYIDIDKNNDGQEVLVVKEKPDFPSTQDYTNPGVDTSQLQTPSSGVLTRSRGKLKLDNGPVDLDDSIQPFIRSKKQPYRDVMHQDTPDSGEVTIAEPIHDRIRRSERLNQTTWGPSKVAKALMGSTGYLLVLPSAL